MECLSEKIDNIRYRTVERKIANYYGLGCIDSSELPTTLSEDTDDTYYIDGTRKHGEFYIKITKQPDGTYWLFVSAYNLKNHK